LRGGGQLLKNWKIYLFNNLKLAKQTKYPRSHCNRKRRELKNRKTLGRMNISIIFQKPITAYQSSIIVY
jgi:hypothetical protein